MLPASLSSRSAARAKVWQEDGAWVVLASLGMDVLLLGILAGSKSCLLGPRPDAAAAPLLRLGMGHLRQYDSKMDGVAFMPATTLPWRNQCEYSGLQCPEERNGNLFSSH